MEASKDQQSEPLINLSTTDGKVIQVKKNILVSTSNFFKNVEDLGTGNIPTEASEAEWKLIIRFLEEYTGERYKQIPDIEKPFRKAELDVYIKDPWILNYLNSLKNEELFRIVYICTYYEILKLQEYASAKIAIQMYNKSSQEMRDLFNIKNDMTKEEEQQAKEYFNWVQDIYGKKK